MLIFRDSREVRVRNDEKMTRFTVNASLKGQQCSAHNVTIMLVEFKKNVEITSKNYL